MATAQLIVGFSTVLHMEHQPNFILAPDPPPFPSPSRTVDFSSLEFILALVALIAIPALIYTFFFSIKCPPSPFSGRSGQRHHHSRSASPSDDGLPSENRPSSKELVSDVKYQKDAHVKEIGIECPVCLSAFADGEEVKQLSVCKHSFHAPCIDLWLNSHSNCPVCRATVGVKRPNNRTTATSSAGSRRQEDLHQGLPDAASLV